MMPSIELIGVAMAAATGAAGAILGYLSLRRRTSGQVSTTDAQTLWDEARDIRREYKRISDDLRIEAREAKKEAATAKLELAEVTKRLTAAEEHGRHCDEENASLRAELDALRNAIVSAAT